MHYRTQIMHYRTLLLAGAAATLATSISGMAYAAASPSATAAASDQGFGEVLVTARKREESIQRIPVAVTAQSGSQLQEKHITQPTDLEAIVPSLQIHLASGSDNSALIALRGQVASDSLLGVSAAVGLYEDGVNIPHPFGSNNAFFDLSQVEVLKGPQGTLYGRNTTGGAITITTKGADYNGYHGFVEGEVGNFRDYRGSFAINLPIIADKLALRLAYQHWSQDGFGHSLITGQTFGNDHNDDLVRTSLKFDPTPNFDAVLKVEYGRAHHNGAMIADVYNSPTDFTALASEALWSNFAANAPIVGAAAGGDPVAFGKLIGIGGALLAPCVGVSLYTNCSATHQFDNVTTWHGALDMKWKINDAITLRSVTGVHYFTNTKVFDLDSVQAQILEVGYGAGALQPDVPGITVPYPLKPDQQSTQWSQEFNLSGQAFDKKLDWLLGAYGSWDNGHGAQNSNAVTELITLFYGSPQYLGTHDGLKNTTNTYAFFTQEDYHFTKQISLTLGGRYTHEHIGQVLASWGYFPGLGGIYLCTETKAPPPNPADPSSCATNPAATGPGGSFQSADFHGYSYLASLNFQVTDDVLIYLKTARGFRGGAFGRTAQIPAKPETDTDYELGIKGDFLDHRVRADLAIFDTQYRNKQESAAVCSDGKVPGPTGCSSGTFSTILENAATARIRGVEFEGQVRPATGLSIFGDVSYTDTLYTSFPGAVSGSGSPPKNPDGSLYNGGDAAGLPLGAVPRWKGDIGGRYEMPVGPGIAAIQADYSIRGAYPITPLNQDPNTPLALQQSINGVVGLLNGRVEYKIPNKGLTMSLWATNLTNKGYGYQGITSVYTGGIGTEIVQPPRTFGFTVHLAFGE